jgi:hypothetical protein
VACFCEHGNELSRAIKMIEFLDQLSDCWLLRLDFAALNYMNLEHDVMCFNYFKIRLMSLTEGRGTGWLVIHLLAVGSRFCVC